MKAPRAIWVLLVAGVLALHADDGEGSGGGNQLARFRAVDFSTVKTASVARITDKERGSFHGYRLVTPWDRLTPKNRDELVALLHQPITSVIKAWSMPDSGAPVMLSTLCLPHPGYAVRLKTDRGTRDFAICLECADVAVYGRKKDRAEFWLENDALTKLRRCYEDEFAH